MLRRPWWWLPPRFSKHQSLSHHNWQEAFLELTSARQSDYTRKLSDLRLFYVLTTWYLCRYKLASYMIENVTKRGYHKPTPIQMQAVPLMIHVSASWLNHYLVLYCHYMFWCKNLSANFWPTNDQQSGNIWGTVHPNPGQHGSCRWTGGWQSVTCWCSARKLSVSIIILPYILSKLQWKCWLQDVFYQVTW